MNKKRPGGQTAELPSRPCLLSWASVVGKKEGEGPLADTFDMVGPDDSFGEKSWEKA